jgi:hypothetical protein
MYLSFNWYCCNVLTSEKLTINIIGRNERIRSNRPHERKKKQTTPPHPLVTAPEVSVDKTENIFFLENGTGSSNGFNLTPSSLHPPTLVIYHPRDRYPSHSTTSSLLLLHLSLSSGFIFLSYYLWHIYNQRLEANLRDKVKNILFEYLPADDYNYVEMEMEDRSFSPTTRPLLVPQIV